MLHGMLFSSESAFILLVPLLIRRHRRLQNHAYHLLGQRKTTKNCLLKQPLYRLGVLLLELYFGQCMEDQTHIWDQHLVDGKPHPGTAMLTARDWLEEVEEEEPDLAPIIRSCVLCTFPYKSDWANNEFTQAFYANVVELLEKIARKWEKAGSGVQGR
jgi:hypothetical protein